MSSIDSTGLWFIRNNIMRDLAALNKAEMLPWDEWGLADKHFEKVTNDELPLVDKVARLTTDNNQFDAMCEFYDKNDDLRVSRMVTSHTTYGGMKRVEMSRPEGLG